MAMMAVRPSDTAHTAMIQRHLPSIRYLAYARSRADSARSSTFSESRGPVLPHQKQPSSTESSCARNGLISRGGERIRHHRCNSSTLQVAGFLASMAGLGLVKSARTIQRTIPPISSVQIRPIRKWRRKSLILIPCELKRETFVGFIGLWLIDGVYIAKLKVITESLGFI
jgi:hypothetical protein